MVALGVPGFRGNIIHKNVQKALCLFKMCQLGGEFAHEILPKRRPSAAFLVQLIWYCTMTMLYLALILPFAAGCPGGWI